jgi:hypothetical protein
MNDARVDHIEEKLTGLDQKVDGLSLQLHESTSRLDGRIDALGEQLRQSTSRLDGRIDALTAEMKAGFENVFAQTQAGFDDHRRYTEFLVLGVREDMSKRFNQVERRFDGVDERFDRMDGRFDRLERLIKERR